MSCVSLAWQTRALRKLASPDINGDKARVRGLLRTSVCRVAAAALYVGVGVNELFVHVTEASVTFCVFCVVQVLWQLNASADVRLRKSLTGEAPTGRGRHRRRPSS